MAAIDVKGLTYAHERTFEPALNDIVLSLPPGSRTLLIGANGG